MKRETEAVIDDLRRAKLIPQLDRAERLEDGDDRDAATLLEHGEALPPPSRRRRYVTSSPPHDGFNPSYAAFAEAHKLYHGLKVETTVDVDPYHEWLENGRPKPVAVDGVYPPEPLRRVRKTIKLRVRVAEMDIHEDFNDHCRSVYGRVGAEDYTRLTDSQLRQKAAGLPSRVGTVVVEEASTVTQAQADRIERKLDETLALLGAPSDELIERTVEEFISSTLCGVNPFAFDTKIASDEGA